MPPPIIAPKFTFVPKVPSTVESQGTPERNLSIESSSGASRPVSGTNGNSNDSPDSRTRGNWRIISTESDDEVDKEDEDDISSDIEELIENQLF
ncbi:hypothetical protein G210_2206, partial [Candida maltosa Xu316]